jgi:SulP family sulfate permease
VTSSVSIGPAWASVRRLLPHRSDLEAVRRRPGRDLLAGITVAIVALPLALGFGVASGLGAAAGLATAIVAGAVAAIFGGSNVQVSGPTGAMTVVLVPIVHQHGATGVFTVGLLAGLILVMLALARAGQYIRYIPVPVLEGFTAGIAVVIALQQVPAALGVPASGAEAVTRLAWDAVVAFVQRPNGAAVAIAAAVAAVMLIGARWRPATPFSLVAVGAATVVTYVGHLDVARIGALPATLPAPSLGFIDLPAMPSLLTAAVAVAALAALESLLSATVADGMTVGQQHDPNRELFGQGLANIAAPMFGGVPATAAIARTAVNVRSGAASRLSALSHAVILAGILLVAAPLVAQVPLAALAGVLLATAARMVELSSLAKLSKASRSDALVVMLTAATTVLVDLVTAVVVGLAIAGALILRKIARAARVDEVPLDAGDHTAEEHALITQHVVAYRIDGPLFFAASHRFLLEFADVAHVHVIILRLSRITAMDATGAIVLNDIITRLEHRGITVYVSGLRPEHMKPLTAVGVVDRLVRNGQLFDNTPSAIAAARRHLRDAGILPAGPGPRVDHSAVIPEDEVA